jgi:hypothetical protein
MHPRLSPDGRLVALDSLAEGCAELTSSTCPGSSTGTESADVKPRARSYDVFDTCLVRTLARPADLFFLLGRRMLMLKGLPASRSLVAAAANVRLRAEQEARRRSTAQDLDIGAIYRVLPEVDVLGFDPETMMREELALERHHLRPVPGMAQRIDQWRPAGDAHPVHHGHVSARGLPPGAACRPRPGPARGRGVRLRGLGLTKLAATCSGMS